MLPPTYIRESLARAQGLWPVAGIDEVGRGPLAGPVVAAAVLLDPDNIPDGLADSKALKAAQREALFPLIAMSALGIGVGSATAAEIDQLNIRAATFLAMQRAVAALPIRPALLLVDGRDRPDLGAPVESIIKGDASVASIAAASIIAKVIRDRMMVQLGLQHPVYGFAAHAGYGTPAHLAAIAKAGPCLDHRFSFAPVKGHWQRGSITNTIKTL
jgi:ribonuclease HII